MEACRWAKWVNPSRPPIPDEVQTHSDNDLRIQENRVSKEVIVSSDSSSHDCH